MSMTFVSGPTGRNRPEPTQQTVQSLLDENSQLIQAIVDYQSKGKAYECTQYQQLLHRNLVYLATLADSTQSMQNTIPAPGSQSGSSMKTPPTSATPPAGSGMLQPGLPDMTPNSGASSDIMSNTPGMNTGMPSGMNDPLKSNMPPQMGGMSVPSTAGYGVSSVGGMGQSTSSPPQLQHPPMTAQSHMGYPNPSQSQPGRPVAPPTMSGPMGNMPPQVPIQSHAQPMGQHMMSQNQQQSQQYMIQQQRQMQFRQGAPQQMPQQQQSLSHSHPGYGPGPTSGGMPSGNMMPGYAAQQQSQRYNPYRQPPQQQGLSHMPYPNQQQPSPMQGQSIMGQQPSMGQAPVGQSPMQQPPLV